MEQNEEDDNEFYKTVAAKLAAAESITATEFVIDDRGSRSSNAAVADAPYSNITTISTNINSRAPFEKSAE